MFSVGQNQSPLDQHHLPDRSVVRALESRTRGRSFNYSIYCKYLWTLLNDMNTNSFIQINKGYSYWYLGHISSQ